MSYGMAALGYRDRPLVTVIRTNQGDSTEGGIKFTDKRNLPDNAFDALVAPRRDEIDAALSRSAREMKSPR